MGADCPHISAAHSVDVGDYDRAVIYDNCQFHLALRLVIDHYRLDEIRHSIRIGGAPCLLHPQRVSSLWKSNSRKHNLY